MTIKVYDVGDVIRVAGTFATANGTPVDPSALVFKTKLPSGTTTTLTYGDDVEVVRSAAGSYYVDVTATAAGDWFWRWEATGTGASAAEGQFRVLKSAL